MKSIIEQFSDTANDPDRTTPRVKGADATLYLRLGDAYAQKGCYEQALEAFQQAISLQPDCAQAYLGLGGVYSEMRCRQEAANAFQQAIRIQPDLMEAHYGYGISSGQIGQLEEAISALEHARTLVGRSIYLAERTDPDPLEPRRFFRLPRLSLPKRTRTPKPHGPTPMILRAKPVGPLTWREYLRTPRAQDAMILTGFIAILAIGGYLLAPLFQSVPEAALTVPKLGVDGSHLVKSNAHPTLLAHRSEVASPDALIHAVEAGDIPAARSQLDENISADTRDKGGRPLLILATDKNDADMVDELLDRNADPNAQDTEGKTPLMHAVDEHHNEITENLLKRGANVKMQSAKGITALMFATMNDDLESVKLLAHHGADLNIHADNNDTALTLAVASGKSAMVKELLDLGADPTQPGVNGKTAAEIATQQGQQEILDLLKKSTSGRERSLSLAR